MPNASLDLSAARMQPGSVRETPQAKFSTSLTLAAMSLGYGVVQLDVTIVNTALNSMGSALGGGVSELQWVVSTYTIAFASFILTAGALGDRIGAKNVFMAGFAVFTAASLACALAPTSVFLIAARAAQGLGAAILVPNSLALLSHAYPDDKARVDAARNKALKDNSRYDNEYRYIVNGREKVLWTRGAITYKGNRKMLIGTVMDITNRHAMLQKLRESENSIRKFGDPC